MSFCISRFLAFSADVQRGASHSSSRLQKTNTNTNITTSQFIVSSQDILWLIIVAQHTAQARLSHWLCVARLVLVLATLEWMRSASLVKVLLSEKHWPAVSLHSRKSQKSQWNQSEDVALFMKGLPMHTNAPQKNRFRQALCFHLNQHRECHLKNNSITSPLKCNLDCGKKDT